MKTVLNIAVSGLSLNVLDQIKIQIFSSLPKGVAVHWVNIAEQHIDLLLVNELFFHSSSIQKILLHHVSHYLRLVKTADHGGQIVGDTLFYPVQQLDELKHWLHTYCLDESATSLSQVNTALKSVPEPLDIAKLCDEIFNSNNGFMRLFDAHGFLALIDTATHRIWVNPETPMPRLNHTINQGYATQQFVQQTIQQQQAEDLYIGLWQMLNRSLPLTVPPVQLNQYFKLDIWPQVPASSTRKDLFKLAACFAEGANIKIVADHLGLSQQHVLNFVAIAQLLGMGKLIESQEAKFMTIDQVAEDSQVNKIGGFFGKLRKKLGL